MTFNPIFKVGLCLLVASAWQAMAAQVDPEVVKALRRNARSISVIVHLQGHYDLGEFNKEFTQRKLDLAKRGSELAKRMEAFHQKSSERIVGMLKATNARGLEEMAPLWITNSLRVKASSEIVEKLLSMNGIESVVLDSPKETFELEDAGALMANMPNEDKISWGVEKVRAPELWKQQIDGRGVLVAMVDTGANLKHPDLIPNLWKNPGETGTDENGKDKATNGIDDDANGFIDDVVGWNFETKNNTPEDAEGHGSQTAGIVGGAGTQGTKTGVAPGATLMIVRTCCNSGTKIFESNTWESLQYAIKNNAKVISMSLSVKPHSNPSYAKWRQTDEVILAAGIVHVNSAGNLGSGNVPNNIGAPGSNPPAWLISDQPFSSGLTSMITIGATDQSDKLRRYSSTGPVTWESVEEYKDYPYEKGEKGGLMKPDVCGPSEVPSLAMKGEGYTTSFGGTSSATPNVAGVVTLLLSAHPNLTVAQVTEALQMSAVEVGERFTNQCGTGRVDAVAAVEYAKKF